MPLASRSASTPSVSLNAAARIPHLHGSLGPQLHTLILCRGLASNAHVSASLIQAYCSCGRVASARSVFDEMTGRDIFAWNVTIAGYVTSGNLARVRELFDVMPERNVVSWTTLIGAYAQMRRQEAAVDVFRRMQVEERIKPDGWRCCQCCRCARGDQVRGEAGVVPEMPLMNAIIDMYVKCGCVGKAVEVFEGMEL